MIFLMLILSSKVIFYYTVMINIRLFLNKVLRSEYCEPDYFCFECVDLARVPDVVASNFSVNTTKFLNTRSGLKFNDSSKSY